MPSIKNQAERNERQWSTLADLGNAAEVEKIRHEEFLGKPAEAMEEGGALRLDRRSFIKASGAAAVFAGLTGCNKVKKIVPYHTQPEEAVPGNPVYYASMDGSGSNGLLVKTIEGRPIKLEGHPEHPLNSGKLDARGNAALLDLYDPDRLRQPVNASGQPLSWDDADKQTVNALKLAGSKAALVLPVAHGPAHRALVEQLKMSFPGLRVYELDAKECEAVAQSQAQCYGQYVVPHFRFDRSQVTVLLGVDPVADGPHALEAQRELAESRRLQHGKMGRLLAFEPLMSSAGSIADERYRVGPEALADIALSLVQLVSARAPQEYAWVGKKVTTYGPAGVEKKHHLRSGLLTELADELWDHRGKSLLVAGGPNAASSSGPALMNAVNLLNSMLGNDGITVQVGTQAHQHAAGTPGGLQDLLGKMQNSQIEALVIVDLDLAYRLAPGLKFVDALKKVPFKLGMFTHRHATGKLCDIVMPNHHFLESWSDGEPKKGLFTMGQPTIQPLWDTREKEQSLLRLARMASSAGEQSWHDFIREVWSKSVYPSARMAGSFDAFFIATLRTGIYDIAKEDRLKDLPPRTYNPSGLILTSSSGEPAKAQLVLYRTVLHGDGTSMNNPWLLETPDPVTKVCWDHVICVSMSTAKAHGYSEGEILEIKASGRTVEVPVYIQPGIQDGVYALGLGWGNAELGHVAKGPEETVLGVNALELALVQNGVVQLSGIPIKTIEKTGKKIRIANVQGHHYMIDSTMRAVDGKKRGIAQETTLEQFDAAVDFAGKFHYHMPTDITMWGEKHHGAEHKWAMAVDTNTCTGCGACIVSCQAENNIPTVGKDEVILNREMHWIRIDRYFTTNDNYPDKTDDVDVLHQPVMCQHCDNAPCEIVCPVLATTHTDEGLNTQTYNRCVGTRYCSNNCPYKVRHFNWYEYSSHRAGRYGSGDPLKRFLRQLRNDIPDRTQYPLMLQLNPDVTVRTYGVMEKCSFCVQRITRWKNEERELGRALPEAQKQSACQQACPSNALVFGDILNPDSAIAKLSHEKGRYRLLMELNVQSNVHYMTRIRNRKPPEGVAGHGPVDAHGASSHGDHHG